VHRKRNIALGLLTLAIAFTWHYHSSRPTAQVQPAVISSPKVTKAEAPVSVEQSPEARVQNFQNFQKRLAEAGAQYEQARVEIRPLEGEPVKRLIKNKDGSELIEISFADGGKTYLPNSNRYDVSTGALQPKEF
jgi:alkylation response protein AidB-like acyl-CoA dehydrogenase